MQWQLQDAKNRFSEVVDRALTEGPQLVTRRGREVVFIVSANHFHELVGPEKPISAFFRESPLAGVELDLDRSPDTGREVDL